ncbi:MAG: hypothetical protein K2W93_08935 [Burkholderiaceae bacterium]|nr:hypothetical protein [Burkholderiaceae bacterium]
MKSSAKPCILAINNSGSWKKLGPLDAADEASANSIMEVAADLMKALHHGKPAKQWPTLRICTDDGLAAVLMYWTVEKGWHQNPRTTS